MNSVTSEVRLDVRMSSETKRRLAQAAELTGASLSDFVRRAAEAEARAVLETSNRITLEGSAFDRFIDACEKATGPNAALRRSAERARGYGVG